MDPYKAEGLSGYRGHDECSSLLNLMSGGSSSEKPLTNGKDFVTGHMLELQRIKLEEAFQRELKLQREQLKMVEAKCNVILVKIPIFDNRTKEVATLKEELRREKEQRRENERSFLESVENLMEEIVQANLKVILLEGKIGEMEKMRESPPMSAPPPEEPVPSSSTSSQSKAVEGGSEVVGLINDLSKAIQEKFHEFGESQATLRIKIENTRKDLIDSLNSNYSSSTPHPPVEEVVLEGDDESPSPLDESDCPLVSQDESEAAVEQIIKIQRDSADEEETVPSIVSTESLAGTGGGSSTSSTAAQQPSSGDEEGIEVVHGQASTPGRYLPFLCLCGLEYDSSSVLSDHVVEEVMKQVRSTSEFQLKSRNIGNRKSRKRKPIKLLKPSLPSSSSTRRSQRQRKLTAKYKSALLTPAPSQNNGNNLHGIGKQIRDKDGKAKFYCKCGLSYAAQCSLNHHLLGASAGKIFKCTMCPEQYAALYRIKWHMKKKHNVEYCKGQKCCALCGDMFDNMVELLEHRIVQHGAKLSTYN